MLINRFMDLSQLAERMGPDATVTDAMRMRFLLVEAGWANRDTEDIPRRVWDALLYRAATVRAGL